MECLLIQVLREDDNGQTSDLQKIYRYEKLLLEPKVQMSITFENGSKFWIEHINQDLKNQRVILIECVDICHREFWDDDFWKKYLRKKHEEGWIDVPKKWKYSIYYGAGSE